MRPWPPEHCWTGPWDCHASLPPQETLRCGYGLSGKSLHLHVDNMEKLWSWDQRSAPETVPVSATHRNKQKVSHSRDIEDSLALEWPHFFKEEREAGPN